MSDSGNSHEDSWAVWSKYVLKELERLNEKIEQMVEKIIEINNAVSSLKAELRFKTGVWGALGGAIPVAVFLIFWFITNKMGNGTTP